MWYESSFIYHIYPLGFCGAPLTNDGIPTNRVSKITDWIGQLKHLHADTVYLGPVFDSDRHGYDTRDYNRIDPRLGTNEDFSEVCRALHNAGIKILLDGVFNHVGRGFWAFQDVLERRESSPYCDWFFINFGQDNGYHDGLWYEGWEGHDELVRLNLKNPVVKDHLFEAINGWIRDYGIDGLRLDVAYMLDRDFLKELRLATKTRHQDFFLLGEMIHGDYNEIVNNEMLDSSTNYECYKGLYSSLNCKNMHEIAYSLNRQFGPEEWTLYKGKPLVAFADNHDVDRIASTLLCSEHLPVLYGILFGIPGIPCLYYGSEWGITGKKEHGDDAPLRPKLTEAVENELSLTVAALAKARRKSEALCTGSYRQICVQSEQLVFLRQTDKEEVIVAVNASDEGCRMQDAAFSGNYTDLITGSEHVLEEVLQLLPYQVCYLRRNRLTDTSLGKDTKSKA